MSRDAMLPCIICGAIMNNAMADSENQPSEGTEFRTFGHYGSTFWDSFEGEEIVLNVCDDCLTKRTSRIARHKRFRRIVVDDPIGRIVSTTTVGRQWITREMVPYFDGPEDIDPITIEPEEIGQLNSYEHVEWVHNWEEIKAHLLEHSG